MKECVTRPFAEKDRTVCQAIAAESALSSYAPGMADLAGTFDGQAPLEEVDRRWVALLNGEIVGFIDISGNHIANLFVHPSAQGRGVGSSLMEVADRETVGDLTLSVFTVNPRARKLYERLGFHVVSEAPVPFRGTWQTVWRMRKERVERPA